MSERLVGCEVLAGLHLLAGQASSPIHAETARRAIAEIERLTRELQDETDTAHMWENTARRLRAALKRIANYRVKENAEMRVAKSALSEASYETFPVQGGDILPPTRPKPWKEMK